jgi:predicted small lipoprotein YifL
VQFFASTYLRVACVAAACCCSLAGCARNGPEPQPPARERNEAFPVHVPGSGVPAWLDLYRTRKIVSISTVDSVVMVTFESQGQRDEVFGHYAGKFGNEENFVSFRDNRDIISFIRAGYGVKITLLEQSKNLWSLECHRQAI